MKSSLGRRNMCVGALFAPSIIRTGVLMPVSSRLLIESKLSHFPDERDALIYEVTYGVEPCTAIIKFSNGRITTILHRDDHAEVGRRLLKQMNQFHPDMRLTSQ